MKPNKVEEKATATLKELEAELGPLEAEIRKLDARRGELLNRYVRAEAAIKVLREVTHEDCDTGSK